MTEIHSTAVVSSKAELGDNIKVGPYAVIEDDVKIGNNTIIGPNAVIYDGARLGNNVKIFQGASVANIPQDLKFAYEKSYFFVGDNTQIREFVTLHRGTGENGESRIGQNCLLMAYAHIAHDCFVGDNVILANSVQVGGHVEIHDHVIIGGATPVHQFSKIGQHAMVGGGFRVVVDVPPFVLAGNEPLRYAGLNAIGLKRRGFSTEDIESIKKAYDFLYNSGLNFSQAKAKIKEEMSQYPHAMTVYNFLEDTKRTILRK